jgi:hypothetical protein
MAFFKAITGSGAIRFGNNGTFFRLLSAFNYVIEDRFYKICLPVRSWGWERLSEHHFINVLGHKFYRIYYSVHLRNLKLFSV